MARMVLPTRRYRADPSGFAVSAVASRSSVSGGASSEPYRYALPFVSTATLPFDSLRPSVVPRCGSATHLSKARGVVLPATAAGGGALIAQTSTSVAIYRREPPRASPRGA